MNPKRMKHIIRAELGTLCREQLINSETYTELLELYPVESWDYSALARWFLIFGSIAVAAGLFILGLEIFEFTMMNLATCLGVLIGGCFFMGWRLGSSKLTWAKRSFELLGSLCIVGLTFTMGIIYSTGSGNWPALLLIDMLILLPLTYVLRNVMMLILCMIIFFTWFGGVTGYVSGWGAYWFGMNYPMRFLLAGLLMIVVSQLHRSAEHNTLRAYNGFFKVWLSGGVFFCEMALWLMSLFGNFGRIFERYLETANELFLFGALWTGFNVAILKLGSQFGLRMLRGYAITFLVIQGYTLYFWHITPHLGSIFATFLAGAVTLALVLYLESKRRTAKVNL